VTYIRESQHEHHATGGQLSWCLLSSKIQILLKLRVRGCIQNCPD